MFDDSFFTMYNDDNEEEKQESSFESSENNSYVSQETRTYSSEKTVVLSIGGSLIAQEKPSTTQIMKIAEKISSLHSQGFNFALVSGGGRVARSYVAAAKSLGATNYSMDELGIMISRTNAMLLIQALGDKAYPEVLTNPAKARTIIEQGKIPVFGGLYPGITTDGVSALVAESLKARFINLTNVDGVYSSDPKENPRAKFYPTMSYERLISMLKISTSKPGQNIVLDLPCAMIIQRSKIETIVLDGSDLNNLENAIRKEEFQGTIISENSADKDSLDGIL